MDAHILILGGGLAGAAAAITFARAGRSVLLIDRDAAPKHKVCGEFLSAEALHLLNHLGIPLTPSQTPSQTTGGPGPASGTWVTSHKSPETAASSPNSHPIHTVRLTSSHHLTQTQLPFPAQSLTRRCLDTLLLAAAQSAGATVLHASIEQLTPTPTGWAATLATGEILLASEMILATGKHDLRGFPRPEGRQNDLVALKMYWKLSPDQAAILQNSVELHLFPHGYAGLQPVEDGAANLTALIRKHRFTQLGGYPGFLAHLKTTNPHAAQRLHGATPLLDKPLALSAIPYGFMRRHALAPNLYAVGDQAAVIPSFTGDGMSIALFTGLAAAQAILNNRPATLFQPQLHHQLHHQLARATLLSQALLHPVAKPFLTTAAHLWPNTLRHAATLTRLPRSALRSLQLD